MGKPQKCRFFPWFLVKIFKTYGKTQCFLDFLAQNAGKSCQMNGWSSGKFGAPQNLHFYSVLALSKLIQALSRPYPEDWFRGG